MEEVLEKKMGVFENMEDELEMFEMPPCLSDLFFVG
jgi:hypothetical protein